MSDEPEKNEDVEISKLDAFNHVTRHSLCNSFVVSEFGNDHALSPEMVASAYLYAHVAALVENDPTLSVAGAVSLSGYFGAKAVYRRLKEGEVLSPVFAAVSKVDMPMFVAGHAYLLQSGLRDFVGWPISITDSVAVACISAASLYAASSDLRDTYLSKKSSVDEKPDSLPPSTLDKE